MCAVLKSSAVSGQHTEPQIVFLTPPQVQWDILHPAETDPGTVFSGPCAAAPQQRAMSIPRAICSSSALLSPSLSLCLTHTLSLFFFFLFLSHGLKEHFCLGGFLHNQFQNHKQFKSPSIAATLLSLGRRKHKKGL